MGRRPVLERAPTTWCPGTYGDTYRRARSVGLGQRRHRKSLLSSSWYSSIAERLADPVQITSSLPESGPTSQYEPIWPGKAPKNAGLHLKLCNCWGLLPTKLRKLSYARLDRVYDVPLGLLRQVDPNPDGSSLELKRVSFDAMTGRIKRLRGEGLSTNWSTQAAAAVQQI